MADKTLAQSLTLSGGVLTTLSLDDDPQNWTITEMQDYCAAFKDDLGEDTIGGAYVRPSTLIVNGKPRLQWEVSLTPFVIV